MATTLELGPSSVRSWLQNDFWSASAVPVVVVGVGGGMTLKEKMARKKVVPVYCTQQQSSISQHLHDDDDDDDDDDDESMGVGIMCDPCHGRGWLVCDFCKGQKTNVKAENNRIYRRCPNCKAVGYVLCSRCKVFKCITYPDFSDVVEL